MSAPKSIAAAFAQAAIEDVEAGGFWFRVHRISSADLLQVRHGILLAALPRRGQAEGDEPIDPDGETAVTNMRFAEAVVCAGVQQASTDGGKSWQRCQVVSELRAEESGAGRVHVSSLPPGCVGRLASAILKLSTDGEAAAARVASFL